MRRPWRGLSPPLGFWTKYDRCHHGYTVLKIHEFYEYKVTQYDPKTGEGGHFVHYIDQFLKLKLEANGYPGWVQGFDDQDR